MKNDKNRKLDNDLMTLFEEFFDARANSMYIFECAPRQASCFDAHLKKRMISNVPEHLNFKEK